MTMARNVDWNTKLHLWLSWVWALGCCGAVTTSKQKGLFCYTFPVPGKLHSWKNFFFFSFENYLCAKVKSLADIDQVFPHIFSPPTSNNSKKQKKEWRALVTKRLSSLKFPDALHAVMSILDSHQPWKLPCLFLGRKLHTHHKESCGKVVFFLLCLSSLHISFNHAQSRSTFSAACQACPTSASLPEWQPCISRLLGGQDGGIVGLEGIVRWFM